MAIRPPPSLGTRRWLTIHLNDCEKRVRIERSSFFGKTPTMRSIVFAASIVCRVDSTRWPVSDASSAIEIVSTSRISPTRITLGAWRRAARRARAKVWVSVPTSRWLMVAWLAWWRYSIGSSIVMMWIGFSSLIFRMIAARVVDLPDPVGPVRRTIPFLSSAISLSTRGQAEVGDGGDLVRDDAEDDAVAAALGEDVDAEAGALGEAVGQVRRARAQQLLREVALALEEPQRDELGVVGHQPLDARVGDRVERSVDLDLGRPAHRQVEVGDAGGRVQHRVEQRVEVEERHAPASGAAILASRRRTPAGVVSPVTRRGRAGV